MTEIEEKSCDCTAALMLKLLERADTWGRKQLSYLTNTITAAAGKLLSSQSKLLKEVDTAHNRLVESAKARTRKAVQQLQEQLNEEVSKLEADKRAAENKVRNEIKPLFEEQARLLTEGERRVTDVVGKFTSRISTMSLSDIEILASGKSVKITEPLEGGGEWSVVVTCPDVEGP